MYKLLKYVLASILLAVFLAGCQDPRGTVRKVTADVDGNGSAVVLKPGLLLTAKHVATVSEHLYIEPEHIQAKVLRVSNDHDLALLEAPGIKCPCAALAESEPSRDNKVAIIGYPLGSSVEMQVRTEGLLQGTILDKYVTSAPGTYGNSGGGLFVGEYLIGIVVEGILQPGMTAFGPLAVPANYLMRSIKLSVIKEFVNGS